MIIRTTQRKSGIVEYLKKGHNKDYPNMEREDRDAVVSLLGDLDLIEKAIKQANKKGYRYAYWHTTISFTWQDFEQFYDPETHAYDIDKLVEFVKEYLKIFLTGYSDEEVAKYAELHFPKLKVDNKGNIRLPHIHIVIPKINLLQNNQIKSFNGTIKNNDLVQTYLAKKYNLDLPINHQRKRPKDYKKFEGTKRKELINAIKQNEILTEEELIAFFKKNNLKYKKVTKKNKSFYEVKLGRKKIALRGAGAEFIEEIAEFGIVKNIKKYNKALWRKIAERHNQKSLEELETELNKLIDRQIKFVEKRRPKSAKKKIKTLQEKQQAKLPTPQDYFFKPQPTKRPTNYTEQTYKEKEEAKKLDKEYIKEIKENLDPYAVLEYAKEKYKLDTNIYEVIGNKINNTTNKQKPKSVIDFLQKEVGLSIQEAFSVADELYKQQLKELQTDNRIQQQERIGMKLSYNTYTKVDYPTKNWKVRELKNKTELETLVKNYPYSPFVFENGYRSSDNTRELTALILDFDNDNKDYLITMQEVLNRLKQAGIKALAVETKSSGKEKGGIVAERFRVIIPITEHIKIAKENREEYAKATELFVKKLGLYNYLDKGALKDIARMYRPSPLGAKAMAINGKAVDFNNYMEQAKKVILREREEQERQRQERLKHLQSIEDNISAYTYTAEETNLTGLTYADTHKILSIPFKDLINYFENIEKEYKEGSYKMIKTDTAKYSVLKNDEVMHDFKSGKTYNKISYLYEKLGINNLISLARALQKITGEEYIKVNENLVKNAIKKATEQATDLYEFNDIVKRECNVEFCRIDLKNNIIKIADIEFQADTKKILDKINENKAEKKAQQQAYKPKRGRGMGM